MAQKKKDSGRSARPTPSPVVLEIPVCRQPREGQLAPDASILPSLQTASFGRRSETQLTELRLTYCFHLSKLCTRKYEYLRKGIVLCVAVLVSALGPIMLFEGLGFCVTPSAPEKPVQAPVFIGISNGKYIRR